MYLNSNSGVTAPKQEDMTLSQEAFPHAAIPLLKCMI